MTRLPYTSVNKRAAAVKRAWTTRASQKTLADALGWTIGCIAGVYRRHPTLKSTHALNGKNGRPRNGQRAATVGPIRSMARISGKDDARGGRNGVGSAENRDMPDDLKTSPAKKTVAKGKAKK